MTTGMLYALDKCLAAAIRSGFRCLERSAPSPETFYCFDKPMTRAFLILAIAALAASKAVSAAEPYSPCGPLLGLGFGPFDYRTASEKEKDVVESHHFTPDVASLRSGSTSSLGGDLDYTLRAFP